MSMMRRLLALVGLILVACGSEPEPGLGEVVCPAGFADCNGDRADGCEEDVFTPPHCGSCDVSCEGGSSCEFTEEEGVVVDAVCAGQPLVRDQQNVIALALDEEHLYLLDAGANDELGNYQRGHIARIPRDGGELEILVAEVDRPVAALVVDATHVYWAEKRYDGNGAVLRAPLDGSTEAVELAQVQNPFALTADDTRLFWSTHHPSSIWSIAKDGADPTQLAETKGFQLVVHDEYLYWWDDDFLRRVPTDGSEAPREFLAVRSGQFVVDGTYVYRAGDRRIEKIPMGGGEKLNLANQTDASSLTLEGNTIYFLRQTRDFVSVLGWALTTPEAPTMHFWSEKRMSSLLVGPDFFYYVTDGTDVRRLPRPQ